MNITDKIIQLLDNEDFQEDILDINIQQVNERINLQEKYGISEGELNYAYNFFTTLSFQNKQLPDTEITEALQRFTHTVQKTPQSAPGMRWLIRIAAILSIPLLLSSAYLFRQLNQQKHLNIAQATTVYNTFKAPMGAKSQIVLPDGSLVWLNSGSSLSFPSQFDQESRKVTLNGEAYFEVVKNERVPMIVSAGSLQVKVYGTKFNLNAYDSDDLIETTLVEGKVSILPKDETQETDLKPGFSATFDTASKKIKVDQVNDMEAFTGWKDGKLLFHDERFIKILKKLERWYNVDIRISDESLFNYTLYATFIDENIEQVLDIFAHSIPISVEYPKRIVQPNGLFSKRTIIIKRDANKTMTKN